MRIRRAQERDMEGINRLLLQVCMVHHKGRPDLFKAGAKKYTDEQLKGIIFKQNTGDNILTDIKTLYIDDLCVEEEIRGQHIGRSLYERVLEFARESDCYNVTLNVWSLNESAMKFYEKCGLKPQKVGMEKLL